MNFLVLAATVAASAIITISVDTNHVVNIIRPLHAVGVGIDSDDAGKVPFLYSKPRHRPACWAPV